MARPLSEEKREAILASAAELVAAMGTGAPTAKIAANAGVGEGTLFTYFPTKDDLLNALFVEIEGRLAKNILDGSSEGATPRERIREIWNRFIDWGSQNPTDRKAIRQLKVSDRVTPESRKLGNDLFCEIKIVLDTNLASHVGKDQSSDYVATILDALAEATHELIGREPSRYEHYREAVFDLFWKGIAA